MLMDQSHHGCSSITVKAGDENYACKLALPLFAILVLNGSELEGPHAAGGWTFSHQPLVSMQVLEVWSETTAPAADYASLLRAQPNERASDEENVTAAQAVSAVEPGKGLKKQPTQVHSFLRQATFSQSSPLTPNAVAIH